MWADGCENIFEKFIYVLKHMDVLERMPWAAQNSVFQKLANIAEVSSLSKEEREAYDESLRQYRDTISVMEGQWYFGHEKGLAEGMEKGMEKGKLEANLENARKMKADNMPVELIVKYTGLTAEEIEGL